MMTMSQPIQVDEGYDRVRHHSAPVVNERIDRMTRGSVAHVIARGRDAIVSRLTELDREWDVDRALMANFAVVGGTALAASVLRFAPARMGMGIMSARRLRPRTGLLGLLGLQMGFLMLHALAGWCPPASLFRRLGFRTQREIQVEREALHRALADASR